MNAGKLLADVSRARAMVATELAMVNSGRGISRRRLLAMLATLEATLLRMGIELGAGYPTDFLQQRTDVIATAIDKARHHG